MSRLILFILFYIVITPIGFILRMAGKDFLNLRTDKNSDSYWEKREIKVKEKIDYERQF